MLPNLLVATAMLILPLVAAPATRPTSQPPAEMPPEISAAYAVAEHFISALRESRWSEALGDCSPEIQEKAKEYPSPEAFFRAVVPLQEFRNLHIKRQTRPERGGWYKPTAAFKLAELEEDLVPPFPLRMSTVVSWQWWVKDINSRWVLDFPATPLQTYTETRLAELRALRKKLIEKEKELDSRVQGLYLRLTPLREQFQVMKFMPFRLELINDGPEDRLVELSTFRRVDFACGFQLSVFYSMSSSNRSSGTGLSSAAVRMRAASCSFMACHSSGVIITSRAWLPLYSPTMPAAAISSMSRLARL